MDRSALQHPAARARAALRRVKAGGERFLGGVLPSASARRLQVRAFADEWAAANLDARVAEGPLWVVLGDSTSQGVGASSRESSYVVGVLRELRAEGRDWHVVNLSQAEAGVADVLDRQLPALEEIAAERRPELVTCAIGSQDVLARTRGLAESIRGIAARLPAGAVLATLPQGLRARARATEQVNTVLWAAAKQHGLRVADVWSRTGAPWRGKYSPDFLHPNDVGYVDWADAVLDAVRAEPVAAPPAVEPSRPA